ncbi:MAG TPA: DoxX family membrane protein [Phycisphaerae bacterium]|nr:DoxX family membrane protein [Phycisphaerae bacterium]HNU44673.1 DoxX family membrane protein [Phycisphaerae bacterium]
MPATPSLIARLDRTGVPLLLARLILGGLLIWMGIVKVLAPIDFLKLMRQYQMLDEQSAYVFLNLVAVVLPWVETLCGVALVLGLGVRGAGLLSGGMLLVFTPLILKRGLELYQAGTLAFCGVKFDCGCGAGEVYLCNKLAENIALLLLSLLVVFSRTRRFCLERWWHLRPATSATG